MPLRCPCQGELASWSPALCYHEGRFCQPRFCLFCEPHRIGVHCSAAETSGVLPPCVLSFSPEWVLTSSGPHPNPRGPWDSPSSHQPWRPQVTPHPWCTHIGDTLLPHSLPQPLLTLLLLRHTPSWGLYLSIPRHP